MSVAELKQQIESLKVQLSDAERYINHLINGKKSAGVESRSALSDLGKTANTLRKSVLTFRESLPTKTRVKKVPIAEVVEVIEEMPAPPVPPVLERESTVVKVKKPRAKKPVAVVAVWGKKIG